MISAFSSPSPFAASDAAPDGLDTAAARQAEAWLRNARDKGDRESFAYLCEPHRKRVWNVVASVTRKSADTDDLAQDALVRAWAALPSYKGDARVFGAWLCRIALNAAHDYQKSAWRRRVLVGIGGFTGSNRAGKVSADFCDGDAFVFGAAPVETHDEAVRRETARRVRAAVAALAPKERVPIWLVYFDSFSLTDVARIENVPESTIRSRVKKGLSRLQKTLHDLNLTEDGEAQPPSGTPAAAASPYAERRDTTPAAKVPPADWKGCVQL